MEIPIRVYPPGSADSELVHTRVESGKLLVGEGRWIDVCDLEIQIGGATDDRIKALSRSTGLMIICNDRRLLDLMSVMPGDRHTQAHIEQTRQHLHKRISASKRYWLTVFAVIALIAAATWLSVDAAAEALVMHVDPKLEMQIGDMLSGKKEDNAADIDMQRRAQAVGKRLVAEIPHNPYNFKFFIKDDETINACAYPGGIVFINSGLMQKANDDELAGVMGHEIGHVIHRDTLRAIAHSAGTITCLALLSSTGIQHADKVITALSMAERLESLQFSRSQEAQADLTGLHLAMAADYKGDGLLKFFQRLQADAGSADNKYLSMLATHPMNSERIAAIEAELKRQRHK